MPPSPQIVRTRRRNPHRRFPTSTTTTSTTTSRRRRRRDAVVPQHHRHGRAGRGGERPRVSGDGRCRPGAVQQPYEPLCQVAAAELDAEVGAAPHIAATAAGCPPITAIRFLLRHEALQQPPAPATAHQRRAQATRCGLLLPRSADPPGGCSGGGFGGPTAAFCSCCCSCSRCRRRRRRLVAAILQEELAAARVEEDVRQPLLLLDCKGEW